MDMHLQTSECILLYLHAYTNTHYSAGCEAGEVRLRGGIDPSNGRVEVCQFTTWGAVCNDEWDDNDARVVCRQLGYNPEGLYGHACKTIIHIASLNYEVS